jgi:glycolate oxidase iron-sulfur subunit
MNELARKLKLTLDEDQLTNCMRCGFCLPACPTFGETGLEAESPRGRIALMKAAADGLLEPGKAFEEQMNHCLGCRACEPACPADVKFGHLLEQAREAVEEHTESHRWWVKAVRGTVFKGLFPHPRRMRLLGGTLKLYQRTGMRSLVHRTGLMRVFPEHLRDMEAILPAASAQGVIERIGAVHPAKGESIATVALFRGCLMDILFTDTNEKSVRLLTEAGFTVLIPDTQTCCGALHAHSGETKDAKGLAKRNIEAFRQAGVDYIVSNAGGCGASLTEYGHLLHNEEEWREAAESFSQRVIDISELLFQKGRKLSFTGKAERVTYQDSCHLRNVMRAGSAPRSLLRQVEGMEFKEMMEADRCCGSAGIYNLTQPEMAGQLLERKMGHAASTKAEYVLTSNPGCLLQMKNGVRKHCADGKMQAEHIVDFLYDRLADH